MIRYQSSLGTASSLCEPLTFSTGDIDVARASATHTLIIHCCKRVEWSRTNTGTILMEC